MKYINLKKYKFNTILNHIKSGGSNFIRKTQYIIRKKITKIYLRKYKFNTILNHIKSGGPNFIRKTQYIIIKKITYIYFTTYNLAKNIKKFNYKNYNYNKTYKKVNYKKYKLGSLYFLLFLFLTTFVYLIIPAFYNYEKEKIEAIICRGINIECSIRGDVFYKFYPTPRIIVKDLVINDLINKTSQLGKIDNVVIKISSANLSQKEKFNFTSIELRNGTFNINLNNLSKYKNLFNKGYSTKSIKVNKTNINFFDNNEYISNLKNIKFHYKSKNKKAISTLKGDFLNDIVIIKYNQTESSHNFNVKFSKNKLTTEIEIQNLVKKSDLLNGKISVKKNKNRFAGTYTYNFKNKEIVFNQTNLRNNFLDGKLNGSIYFSPFFDFDLEIDLNIVNFTKLLNTIINLEKEKKEKLFRISKKINGKINLSSKKILSKYSLIDSFESRLKFINGNILIDQMLFNLGKLGAADINGIINNEKKSSIFKFENNIFIDNKKKFFNKFGVFNKEKNPFNLFISGFLDLKNLNFRLNEIFIEEKYREQDMVYIEELLNENLLSNGYESLFNFMQLKEFVKLINSESN